MARSRSLGHQPGFAELHTTQAVTSLSCAHSNLNPCISLLLILPCHELIVNSSRAVLGTCHIAELPKSQESSGMILMNCAPATVDLEY